MFSKRWLLDAGERAVRAFCIGVVLTFTVKYKFLNVFEFVNHPDFWALIGYAVKVGAVTAVSSVVLSLAAKPFGSSDQVSVFGEGQTDQQ